MLNQQQNVWNLFRRSIVKTNILAVATFLLDDFDHFLRFSASKKYFRPVVVELMFDDNSSRELDGDVH